MRLTKINWRRMRRVALILGALAVILLVFLSNRIMYFSHQRFPILSRIQWNHKPASEVGGHRPVIVGHRGSGLKSTNLDAPSDSRLIGNTRNAIRAADTGTEKADWIEIDVRMSQDEELVLFHDDELEDKTTFTAKPDAPCSLESKDRQTLQSYDVLVHPPEKILSLKDAFAEFHTKDRRWILDIKLGKNGDPEKITRKVISLVEEFGIPKNQVMIFGDHEILKFCKGQGYRLGYTTLFRKHRGMLFSQSVVFERCLENSYDLLVVPVVFVTPQLVSSSNERNIEVWSYDSDDSRDLEYCVECGVNGLIVDFPRKAMSQFRDRGKEHP